MAATDKTISMCLPKGDAMKPLAALLDNLRFPIAEYHSKNRTYRPPVEKLPVRAKIMAEKDVAIQIATGNYDIGFCGMDWIQEHIIRYRATQLHVFRRLGLNKKELHICTGLNSELQDIGDLKKIRDFTVIVSEYPNLAEHFAIRHRLRKFKVFSAWGSVEAYPPEHADAVLVAVSDKSELRDMELQSVDNECNFESDLCLILNRKSFIEKDLSPVLGFFSETESQPI